MSEEVDKLIEIANLQSHGHMVRRKLVSNLIKQETDKAKLLELRQQQFDELTMEVNLEFVVLFLEEFGKPTT